MLGGLLGIAEIGRKKAVEVTSQKEVSMMMPCSPYPARVWEQ